MRPLELFRNWQARRPGSSVMEAWMAGYAAGCDKAFRRGRDSGREEGARERQLLLHALLTVSRVAPGVLPAADVLRTTDSREDAFLLRKLLSEAERSQAGHTKPAAEPRSRQIERRGEREAA